jgi:hypothetical protein
MALLGINTLAEMTRERLVEARISMEDA